MDEIEEFVIEPNDFEILSLAFVESFGRLVDAYHATYQELPEPDPGEEVPEGTEEDNVVSLINGSTQPNEKSA